MAVYINYNGRLLEPGTLLIGASNRGFRYGDGLFETMLMKNGALRFWEDHADRLWEGLRLLAFEILPHFTPAYLHEQITALCGVNGQEALARVRLMVFRGDGSIYGGQDETPHFIIEATAPAPGTCAFNKEGYILGIYGEMVIPADRFSHLKTNNYLPSVMGRIHARRQGWADSILLNAAGLVCETTVANIFLVRNDIIYTPALNQGCVAGIMRKYLLKALPDAGYTVREEEIPVNALAGADEIFITSSLTGLRWVKQLGKKIYVHECAASVYNSFIVPLN